MRQANWIAALAGLLTAHVPGAAAMDPAVARQIARPAVPDPAWAQTQLSQRRYIMSSLDALTASYNCSHVTLVQLIRARRMALVARTELRGTSRRAVPANLAYNADVRETLERARIHAASNACIRPRG